MTFTLGAVIVGIVIVFIPVLYVVVAYNGFIRQRNTVAESWRQVDVELQRRHDLIPNIIETVTASAKFERDTLTKVTQARTKALSAHADSASGVSQQAQAEQELTGALRGLFAVAESYPELKSSQNFLQLQTELATTEDRIAAGRRFYNGNVRALNIRVESVPSNFVAHAFGFTQAEYFEIDDPAVRAPIDMQGAFDELNNPGQPT
ncbi:MAG: LemA family protein [Mycobacteriaceae bacterium]